MPAKKIPLDLSLIEKLASIHCTMNEIAAVCDCSVDTLERRCADIIKIARDKGRSSLRRYQWEAAQKGNTAMLIWLGKQLLGQSDKSDHIMNIEVARKVEEYAAKSKQEQIQLMKAEIKRLEGAA